MAEEKTSAPADLNRKLASTPESTWFKRFLFIPTLGFLILMTIFPLIYSLGVSFFNYTTGGQAIFIGFGNYANLFQDPRFWESMWVTIKVTFFAVSIEVILALLLGFALHQDIAGGGIFRLIIFLPMMLAPLVVGLFWRFLLDQSFGIVNYSIIALGIQGVPWLIDPTYALISVIMVDVWQWTPFVILLVLAGLGTVPPMLLEAAQIDRASTLVKFRHIYWPYLRFPLLLALTFRLIDTLKLFDNPFILTGGGPGNLTTTLSLLGYRYQFQFFQIGMAAAVSWVIVILINIVANILVPQMQKKTRSTEEAVDTGL